MESSKAYKQVGIDLDEAANLKRTIWDLIKTTFPKNDSVVSGVDAYSGVIEPHPNADYFLVSSTDGVGTKARVAALANRHDVVGGDIVNHCVNDILPTGATPLFFLDYIGLPKYDDSKIAAIMQGMVAACRNVGCALIGGETAAMPGVYQSHDYEIVGFIVGTVNKNDYLKPKSTVAVGDTVLSLHSLGLHTNGFSMVRHIFNLDESDARMSETVPDTNTSLGDALLQPHKCYDNELRPVIRQIKGMAHITGGGIYDNIPRILPDGLGVELQSSAWKIPPLFNFIQTEGNLTDNDMFRIFNMGLGMVIICDPANAQTIINSVPSCWQLGTVIQTDGPQVKLID